MDYWDRLDLQEQSDLRDEAACARAYLNLTRCLGGRIVVKEFVCPHCDKDHTAEECGEPREE